MFKVKTKSSPEPKTILKTFRLPIKQADMIDMLSKQTGVNATQIVIQMIDYCLNGN